MTKKSDTFFTKKLGGSAANVFNLKAFKCIHFEYSTKIVPFITPKIVPNVFKMDTFNRAK